MQADINGGKYLEHGEFKGNLYGTSVHGVSELVQAGLQPVLTPHYQVGLLSLFFPFPGKSREIGFSISWENWPGIPRIGFYLINSHFFLLFERFSINCLNFKHYCFKCDANYLKSDFFSSHNNLTVNFSILDFLVLMFFL
jgi:hypothetical protein